MRKLAFALLVGAMFAATARAADIQPPVYGAAPPPPPPGYGPPVYGPPAYGPPPYGYAPPPPVAMVPAGPPYVAPGAPDDDRAIYIEGERYYRDCWWEWGERRCALKRAW
jgi:hypothetical protein